jgi:hypothetical protein
MNNHDGQLATGQIWKTRVAAIEILALGRRFIHYRITKESGLKWVSAQVSAVEPLWEYLKANGARLAPTSAVRN